MEVEPNDTIAKATPTGLTGLGIATVTDALVGNGDWPKLDVDFFAFEINDETPLPVRVDVQVSASGSALDAYLRLFDATGTELVNNDDRTHDDLDARLGTHLLEPGSYYVGVSTSGNPHYDSTSPGSGMPGTSGGYVLIITTEESVSRESPFEPNDGFFTAVPMGSESFEIRGEFIGDGDNGRSDRDVYQLHLTGPARIDVAVRTADIGSVLDPAALLKVSLPDGTCLANDDAPDGSTDSMLSAGVPDARDVAIMVYGAGNPWQCHRYSPPLPGSVGYYDLSVTVTYFDGEGVYEPNDSVTMATLPSSPDGYSSLEWIEGFIGDGPYSLTRGDRDFYHVEVSPSGILAAEVVPAPGSGLDPIMAVYDSAGNRLAVGGPHGGATGQRLMLPVSCTVYDYADYPDGVYVMVMGAKQRFPNDPFVPTRLPYTEIRRQEEYAVGDGPGTIGAYELSVSMRPQSCGLEPNGTLATAIDTDIVDEGYYVCSEAMISDAICDGLGSDVDMWSVELTRAPAILEVTVPSCRAQDPSDIVIRVFDRIGNELARTGDSYGGMALTLEVPLDDAGTYYVGMSWWHYDDYDPLVPCSIITYSDYVSVNDMIITLTQPRPSPDGARTAEERGIEPLPLFATRMDDASNMIDALDPLTGSVTASFPAPEPRFGAGQGLAVGGESLFYLGAGRYPKLYRLNPLNGVVLDQYILWQGSGYYSDITILASQLYLLDFFQRSIHVIDPAAGKSLRTLNPGPMNGITMGGGLAALDRPNRLYVSDAFNSGRIIELNSASGAVTAELRPTANRPTALAGIAGTGELWVADWLSTTVEVVDRGGNHLDGLELAGPVGSLAGRAFAGAFADCNDNGMSDDWDIDAGISEDCNGNGIPDQCDTADGGSLDCNANGLPDECETDCNGNGVPDRCDIDASIRAGIQGAGTAASLDCNGNGIPDECEEDCNDNGIPDACDIADGTSEDADGNGRPDECEGVLFVDDDAPDGGDGRSWATALNDLQSTLRMAADRALGISEVHLGQGTYTPVGPGGRRAATFEMASGVALRGGYAGYDSPNPAERDPVMHTTILSGDLNRDDLPDRANIDDNSYHVVTASGVDTAAVLDGLTITAGYANGYSWVDRCGAGIYNEGGDPTLRNCMVVGNHASYGNDSPGRTSLGVGMYNSQGKPTLVRCTFIGNSAVLRPSYGGGVFNVDSSPTFVHCSFMENHAHHGGGMANANSDSILIGCTFAANDAFSGGGVYSEGGRPTLTSCTFSGNDALVNGGAMWNLGGWTTLVNCTLASNSAGELGGGLYNEDARLTVSNCALWANRDRSGMGESAQMHGGTPMVTFTYIQGLDSYAGNGNTGDDPLFADPYGPDGIAGTNDDNWRLSAGSPAIDAGDPEFVPGPGETDMDGHARVLCGRVDMGAYEFGIGDYDCDEAVDLNDFAYWLVCMAGPQSPPNDGGCQAFDFNLDGDVDLEDFAGLQKTVRYIGTSHRSKGPASSTRPHRHR